MSKTKRRRVESLFLPYNGLYLHSKLFDDVLALYHASGAGQPLTWCSLRECVPKAGRVIFSDDLTNVKLFVAKDPSARERVCLCAHRCRARGCTLHHPTDAGLSCPPESCRPHVQGEVPPTDADPGEPGALDWVSVVTCGAVAIHNSSAHVALRRRFLCVEDGPCRACTRKDGAGQGVLHLLELLIALHVFPTPRELSGSRRRVDVVQHHCRGCGKLFCALCCPKEVYVLRGVP